MMIINDNSRVVNKLEASLTDDARIVIYDCHMFIVQATVWFGISCLTTSNFCFYLQNRIIKTSQTGGQRYSDTSPFSIP